MNSNFMSNEEHFKIARELERHHAIFERIWTISRIRFSKRVPTAGVLFNKKGECIDFIVNPNFWDSQTFYQKCFVLAHECLHITLNHGKRSSGIIKHKSHRMVANFAQDLVINHAIVNRYGFIRNEIDPPTESAPLGQYCWLDKLLPNRTDLTEDENYETYFNALMEEITKNPEHMQDKMDKSETVDDHKFNQGDSSGDSDSEGGEDNSESDSGEGEIDKDDYDYVDMDDYSEDFSDVIDKLNEELTGEEKETLKNFIEQNKNDTESDSDSGDGKPNPKQSLGENSPGTQSGGIWTFAKTPPPKKRKWEAIITDWSKKRMTLTEKEVDQWVHRNRRFTTIDTGILLPTEYEVMDEFEEEDMIEVWFFQDTSGSCGGYKDRFFAIAESMPENRFDMRLFCFDTEIYETDLISKKLYGFGGTYFHIIEKYIQEQLAKNPKQKYPDAVFVVTDGYGSDVSPAKPKNWHWILTPQHSKANFPAECNTYDLAKYE